MKKQLVQKWFPASPPIDQAWPKHCQLHIARTWRQGTMTTAPIKFEDNTIKFATLPAKQNNDMRTKDILRYCTSVQYLITPWSWLLTLGEWGAFIRLVTDHYLINLRSTEAGQRVCIWKIKRIYIERFSCSIYIINTYTYTVHISSHIIIMFFWTWIFQGDTKYRWETLPVIHPLIIQHLPKSPSLRKSSKGSLITNFKKKHIIWRKSFCPLWR